MPLFQNISRNADTSLKESGKLTAHGAFDIGSDYLRIYIDAEGMYTGWQESVALGTFIASISSRSVDGPYSTSSVKLTGLLKVAEDDDFDSPVTVEAGTNVVGYVRSIFEFDYQSECHCSKTHDHRGGQVDEFDYQSECHCSKTAGRRWRNHNQFDYQSECHCSKTVIPDTRPLSSFDYQSECHCSKTGGGVTYNITVFDYQSECHCSKTHLSVDLVHRAFDYQSECHCSKT